MTPTTPAQAREIAADTFGTNIFDLQSIVRSLADQLEAAQAERDAYKLELSIIANANPKNWDAPYNDTASFRDWAQSRACAAIAKGAAHD